MINSLPDHKLRRSLPTLISSQSKTDQSDAPMVNINNIMSQYQKTGMLPNLQKRIGEYLDNTDLPTFEQAHDKIQEARSLFYQLPAKIRQQMNNNPAHLETFLRDPANFDDLKKYGLIMVHDKKKDAEREDSNKKSEAKQSAQKADSGTDKSE